MSRTGVCVAPPTETPKAVTGEPGWVRGKRGGRAGKATVTAENSCLTHAASRLIVNPAPVTEPGRRVATVPRQLHGQWANADKTTQTV